MLKKAKPRKIYVIFFCQLENREYPTAKISSQIRMFRCRSSLNIRLKKPTFLHTFPFSAPFIISCLVNLLLSFTITPVQFTPREVLAVLSQSFFVKRASALTLSFVYELRNIVGTNVVRSTDVVKSTTRLRRKTENDENYTHE